jgi:hypothetical protein
MRGAAAGRHWIGVALAVALAFAALPPQADASTRYCGKVRIVSGEFSFRVHMRARGVHCRRARRVVTKSIFGQRAPALERWTCQFANSRRGRCLKGRKRIVYAKRRERIPPFRPGGLRTSVR